jgi:hypothetical protein
MLDYDDNPHQVYDADDFSWKLYFKRSCVDRKLNQVVDYGDLPILSTAYCVVDDMVEPPEGYNGARSIGVSCLFENEILEYDLFSRVRAPLLKFSKNLETKYSFSMQVGLVSECGPIGRSRINKEYKKCLFDSKIILHANPDFWEGDSRLWEALSSGALVFVDRMCQPITNPLVDGEHVIFYDPTEDGLRKLEQKIVYYLQHDAQREAIGKQGRDFVLSHHRSIHRVNAIFDQLSKQDTG